MRKALLVAGMLLLSISAPAMARAADLGPTPGQIAKTSAAAYLYWESNPACGTPTIVAAILAPGVEGQTTLGTCVLEYDSEHDYRDFPILFCTVIVHEWGHQVLGMTYFASSNPTDPSHSPNPRSVMYHASARPRICRDAFPHSHEDDPPVVQRKPRSRPTPRRGADGFSPSRRRTSRGTAR